MSYLQYTDSGTSMSGLTRIWGVSSNGAYLGMVKWYAPWRRYVFEPGYQTLYDTACLRELATFCEAETTRHKIKNKS